MNYRKVYMQIISAAKNQQKLGLRVKGNGTYYEAHHILPRSLFPNWIKRKSNIVLLTAREHYFCHQLLTKIYPGYEMLAAWFRLCTDKRHRVTMREYERLKTSFCKAQSKMRHKDFEKHFDVGSLEKGENFGKIDYKRKSKEKVEKIVKFPKLSAARKGRGFPHTEEHKKLVSTWTKGREAPWAADSKLILGLQIYCKELDKTFCSMGEVKRFLGVASNTFGKLVKTAKWDWFEYRNLHWKVVKLPEKRKIIWA